MAKQSKPRAAREKTRSELAGAKKPIFQDGVSNVIQGEVLLQLEEGAAAEISESIPRGPSRGARAVGPATLGFEALDKVLARLKVNEIVRLHPPAPPVSEALEHAVPMASTFRLTFSAGTVEAAVEQLKAVGGVQFAEPNRYRETCVVPNDPSFPSQWGLTKINGPAAWDRTKGSPAIVVAVIDTGVDLDHPELAPLLVPGTDMVDLGPSPVPPPGFRFEGDFQGRDNNPQDEVGHGTHVAGTIACLTNNGAGVAGVTWNCRVMPVRVLARIVNIANPSDVRGLGSSADIAAGIRWAVDNGARVLNLSLGGSVDTQVERDAVAYAIAHGAVVVAAMGNGGPAAPPSFPGAYPDVVAVGAIDQTDHRAAFSQVGPHIDVAGPGVGILSTVWDNGFATMSGTSMATPHVSGVVALVLSCNSNLTAAQAADIVRQTARPLRDNPVDPVPNNNYGFGCIDAQAAVGRACPQASVPILSCPRRSVVTRCPSFQLACASVRILACRSVVTRCQSLQVICFGPSVPIVTCPRPSNPLVTCPIPSVTIRCPSGPVCGIDNPIERPGFHAAGEGLEEPSTEQYSSQCGSSEEDWAMFDPYSWHYGEGGDR